MLSGYVKDKGWALQYVPSGYVKDKCGAFQYVPSVYVKDKGGLFNMCCLLMSRAGFAICAVWICQGQVRGFCNMCRLDMSRIRAGLSGALQYVPYGYGKDKGGAF